MARKPSPETELRSLRREYREVLQSRDAYQREAMVLRGQLNKAQAETGVWQRRFDELLSKCRIEGPAVGKDGGA